MTSIKNDRRFDFVHISIIFKLRSMHTSSFSDFEMALRNKDTQRIGQVVVTDGKA